jgi:hypothetical protein
MFMYAIDKDVPPPDEKVPSTADGARSTGYKSYPFTEMQPGDSVFIKGTDTTGNEYAAARVLAYKRRRKGEQFRFMARAEGDGVRIWRIV